MSDEKFIERASRWSQKKRDENREYQFETADQWDRVGETDLSEFHLNVIPKIDAAQRSAKPNKKTPTIEIPEGTE